jgi:hypothetical protein
MFYTEFLLWGIYLKKKPKMQQRFLYTSVFHSLVSDYPLHWGFMQFHDILTDHNKISLEIKKREGEIYMCLETEA